MGVFTFSPLYTTEPSQVVPIGRFKCFNENYQTIPVMRIDGHAN